MDCPFIVNGRTTPSTGWVDDVATDFAIGFIREQRNVAKPWSLILGFKTPHQPWESPARAATRYVGEKARPAPNRHAPPIYLPGAKAGANTNLNYFRCLTAMDECVGRVLEALDQAGFAASTIVIFTSDNGVYLGAHATGDKRSAYEESLRVPFLVRYPALGAAARGRVVDEMVLNLDLAPTLLDFAGIRAPGTMQGRSWRPLLTGEAVAWRQSWFYAYFTENQKNTRVPDITAVRTVDAKLIKYPGHPAWTELFDLKNDPYETRNLIDDPASAPLRVRMLAEHDRLVREVNFRVPPFVDRPPDWGQPGSLAGDLSQR
jgi:arylsulfatase A-like enzyme